MKVVVIGGGMAGLTYAIVACKNGYDVTVVERNARVGKKIAVTGNGKCNIGNANVDKSCYNSSEIVQRVLAEISVEEYREFLRSCGIFTYQDGEGRMYPLSDSASNVVDCLRFQLEKYGATLILNAQATAFAKEGNGYVVTVGERKIFCDKAVLACGSPSQASAPDLIPFVPSNALTPVVPSLVPVKVRNMDGMLNGLRVKANVSLYNDGFLLGQQSGEVLFRDYGLSGICIFDLSAIIARRAVARKEGNYIFALDVVPQLSEWELAETLYGRRGWQKDKLFYGILHNKLAEHIVKRTGNASPADYAHTAKFLTFPFEKLLDWSMSQVTAGGVSARYMDQRTFELSNGIVALGEVLNVDGLCGGNNLYFASASALCTFTKEQRKRAYSLS